MVIGGEHRLFLQSRDNDDVTFTDTATDDFKKPSRVRTVIAADFDNDGNEDIFFNNIPGDNRLFTKIGVDTEWNQINIGQAREPTMHGTGAAVFDMDGDGILELIVSHGESASEPLTLYRASSNTGVSANAFLRVLPKTRGGGCKRGSVVTLTPGSQMRVIDSGSGYLCQMEPVAHFGLGPDSEAADTWSVTVQFPDGVRVTKTGLAKNQLHVIGILMTALRFSSLAAHAHPLKELRVGREREGYVLYCDIEWKSRRTYELGRNDGACFH